MSDLVLVHVRDTVALVTLNNPDKRNAWSQALEASFFTALDNCESDHAVRAVVVTGAGTTFCPGLDMEAATRGPHGERPPMSRLPTLAKPVIAAINGGCAGVGLALALSCDLRFAAESAKLTTSFARRGLPAEHGLAWTLPRVVGTARALDLLLSGRVVVGAEAAELGLVDRVVGRADLLDEATRYAGELASYSSPTAMFAIKQEVYRSWDSTLGESCARAEALRRELRAHPDFHEGVESFFAKRPPAFAPLTASQHTESNGSRW